MTVYVIGDVQGCYDPLRRLLERLRFDPADDTLWLVGDLVNRGPQSLDVLRFVSALADSAIAVLGNHDLTLLAVAAGHAQLRTKDTFQAVLAAPDRESLLDWLRRRPLLHHDPVLGFTMAHAGLAPQWDLAQAVACAHELESALRGPDHNTLLGQLFGDEPRCWRADLQGIKRLRCIVNYFTRMRFCYDDGSLCFAHKGPPGSQPAGLKPWFRLAGRKNADLKIVFGHWASMGYYRERGIYALESGCGWGHQLTALRLDGAEEVYHSDCTEMA